jgi:predicted amidophosphoribosyltransferase
MRWLDLFYPPLCLHCQDEMTLKKGLFCTSCLKELTLLDSAFRCPLCFALLTASEDKICLKCRYKKDLLPCRKAAVFSSMGPPRSLMQEIKKNERLKDGAAFLITQFFNLNWKDPDLIIPLPELDGKDYNFKLAKEFSSFLNLKCKVLKGLKIKWENLVDFSIVTKDIPLEQHLLLIAMVHREDLLQKSVEAILPFMPKELYVLYFCMQEE